VNLVRKFPDGHSNSLARSSSEEIYWLLNVRGNARFGAAGVRSFRELFLHIAAANYNIPTMMGAEPNPATKEQDFDKSTTDKAKIIEQLNQSFAHAITVVQGMSNADFAKPEKKLGPDANDGDVVYLLVTHAHEHLGQSIAYARINGVVPPWTAKAMKKNAGAAQDN
jgi:uncharacterized damage-inducible protein DinB